MSERGWDRTCNQWIQHQTFHSFHTLLYSPHRFRHGDAVNSIKQAINISDLKAISMNLVRANLQITNNVYGILSNRDIKEKITKIGKNNNQ